MNKILPQNIEVEEAVLASILINSQSLAVASIYLKPSSFYRTAHQKIFEASLSLAKKDHKVDLLTVTNKLREDGKLEEVGGAAYLAKLSDEVPVPSSVEQYCNIILDNALKRKIIFAGNEIIKLAYESPAEAVNILDEAQLQMKGIKHNRYRSFTICSDLVSSNYKKYEDLHNKSGVITGISSGFFAIDSLTCGFQNSDLIIIAGRPSQGKTALAASMVANMTSDGMRSTTKTLRILIQQR
jgi:replicative DNA helicase